MLRSATVFVFLRFMACFCMVCFVGREHQTERVPCGVTLL